MKTLKFLSACVQIAIAFTVGALVGMQFNWNPVVSGVATVVGFGFAHRPAGVASDGLDLTAVVANVKNYIRYYAPQIWSKVMTGVDFEQYMRSVPNQKGTYVSTTSRRGSYVQGYQHKFTPKGGVSFHPNEIPVRRMKVDVLFENLDSIHDTYLGDRLSAEGKGLQFQPFIPWFVDTHLIPGIIEDIRMISVKGVYTAPVDGVAGAAINSADGIFTTITNAITAGDLTNIIITGAITSVNVLAKIEGFHKSLPEEYRGKEGLIFCSSDIVQDYRFAWRDAHAQDLDYKGDTVNLWGTMKRLVGLPALNGSSRLLYTPSGSNGNIVKLYDKLVMPNFEFQVVDRNIKMLGDFHRSWGFDTYDDVFANDAA